MSGPALRVTDLATAATWTVNDATAAPPDDLPDTPQAYMAWLRNPGTKPVRRTRSTAGRRYLPKTPRRPHKERDPAYPAAAKLLATLPDLGAALIERARRELGDTAWEALVIRAAELNGDRTA
ncbi:hypothetical protein [Actinomadura bangladeshensis]|uniref:Uncharacterized protein n=1 Tax=Actinomadura bangladeshensis TaxID=453573 RepID=A0A6L9QBU8_9ACTN|nr:hypothetical protein [Actinomadura bangladeshensis]NEA21578.1 hypothetical protein [Actinomadura bangladeshensis]NEA22538.1 hypothetical protein [Actinomadura bangladeshensis]